MKPNPVLIIPDDAMSGRLVVESVTSEAGHYVGPVSIGTSNDGDLLPGPFAHEVPSDYATMYGLVRAGGPYRTAEWRWKTTAQTSVEWKGVDQIGWASNPHDPFQGVSGYRNVQAACFARRLNKIFLYWATGSGTILVRWRAAGGDPTSWTSTSFTLTRPIVTISAGGMSVFELADGTLRLMVVSGNPGATDNDVDVYSSTDGTTWTLASRNVISQAGTGTLQILNMKAAVSGDWIRMIVMVNGTTYSFVSSDRGASFGRLSNFTTAIPWNAQAADGWALADLVGLDDYAGTFLVFYNDGTSGGVLMMKSASRDEDYATPDAWTNIALDYEPLRICAAKTGTHVLVYVVEWDGAAGDQRDIGCVFADRNVAANGDPADYRHFILAANDNSQKTMARSLASCEVDGGLILVMGRCDPDTAGAEMEYGGAVYVQQWTARSMWQDEALVGAASEPLSVWDCPLGSITDWASTLWVNSTGAAASRTWTSDYERFASTANGATGVISSTYQPGATPKWADGANMVCEWVVRQPTPGSAGSDDRTAVRIRGVGTTAGVSIDFSIRHINAQIVIYDNAAASPIATMSGLSLASYFYVGRAAITVHNAATWAEVAVARVDQMGSAWSVVSGTLNSAASGVTVQSASWGHLTGVSGVSSDWRRFAFDYRHDWHQGGFLNPTSLRGAPVSARPWYTTAGVWTQWSGGSGFEFDTWANESRHRNEVDNLFFPSPQATWRSTSLASQQIVLDSTNVGRAYFDHAAVAVFGSNARKVRVAYNSTNSWAAPATETTIYADLVSGLTVSAVASDMSYVDVAGATLSEGEYAGRWLHATNGPWANASITIASQVGNRLFFGTPGWTAVPMQTGNAVVIHGPSIATFYPARRQYRYMLVETSGQTTAAGYYEIGSVIAGQTFGFDAAAVDWEHTDTAINGVDVSDGIGGVRWGFEATPVRREWSGVIRGDASKVRRTFERVLRQFVSLSVKPFAMTWNRDDVPRELALVRYIGDVEFQNAGYRQAADGTWYTVGDANVVFSEEL